MIGLPFALLAGKGLLVASMAAAGWRLFRGPTITDRVVALDLIAGIVLAFSLLLALESGRQLYLTVAFSISVVSFISTVAIAQHLERRGEP